MTLLGVEDFPETGRGTAALRDIEAGEVVLQVPASKLLVASNCSLSAVWHQFPQEEFPTWESACRKVERSAVEGDVALTLDSPFMTLVLMLMAERRRGGESYWSLAIAQFPPMEFSLSEWDWCDLEPLQGTPLSFENVSKHRKQMAAAFVGAVQPLLSKFPCSYLEETPTAEDFYWALMLLYSRGYWLDADDNVPAIVPLADMMNHHTSDHGLVADYFFNEDINCFQVVSNRSYLKGEQVFTTYGTKSNAEWLADYGFLFDNPLNSLRVSMPPMSPEDPYHSFKMEYLASLGLQENLMEMRRENNSDLIVAARIRLLEDNHLDELAIPPDEVEGLAELLTARFESGACISVANESAVYQYLFAAARDYAKILSQIDIEAMEADEGPPCSKSRARWKLALRYRRAEVELANDLMERTSAVLRELDAPINGE